MQRNANRPRPVDNRIQCAVRIGADHPDGLASGRRAKRTPLAGDGQPAGPHGDQHRLAALYQGLRPLRTHGSSPWLGLLLDPGLGKRRRGKAQGEKDRAHHPHRICEVVDNISSAVFTTRLFIS